jgi:hypothetical protein
VVDVGEYDILPFDGKGFEVGTQILADDLHPVFVKVFQESVGSKFYKDVPLDWAKAIKIMSRQRSLQELGHYWRLLWELSVSCPVPYVSPTALPKQIIGKHSVNTSSEVDGVKIV